MQIQADFDEKYFVSILFLVKIRRCDPLENSFKRGE
jgi:hypothetical protein